MSIFLAMSAGASAQSTWVAVAAHSSGLEDSQWQTDVGVLNVCDVDATVEITLHTDTGNIADCAISKLLFNVRAA